MSTHDRDRQPKGQPTGGQFTQAALPASGLSLRCEQVEQKATATERTAYSPFVTVDELNEMLDHSQPLSVRAAVARMPYPGVAEKASHDPSPLVRALSHEGWDLSAQSRRRLSQDSQVAGVLRALRN